MDQYQIEAEKLAMAIDVAIQAIQNSRDTRYSEEQIVVFTKYYLMYKDMALNPEKRYRTIRSLNQTVNDVLTKFQEDSGDDIEFFWREIKRLSLGYKRIDVLAKVLKKSKISNRYEYEVVTDTFVVALQERRITEQEAQKLGTLLTNYQNKRKAESEK